MTPIDIAAARSLTVEDPPSFLLAYHAGCHAVGQGVDTARFLRSLLMDEHSSSAAGFLEGLAVANFDARLRAGRLAEQRYQFCDIDPDLAGRTYPELADDSTEVAA